MLKLLVTFLMKGDDGMVIPVIRDRIRYEYDGLIINTLNHNLSVLGRDTFWISNDTTEWIGYKRSKKDIKRRWGQFKPLIDEINRGRSDENDGYANSERR